MMTIKSQMVDFLEKVISKAYPWATCSSNTPPSAEKTGLKLLQEMIAIWQDALFKIKNHYKNLVFKFICQIFESKELVSHFHLSFLKPLRVLYS